ncbi:DUF222 domain-containing protein [Rhodococcus sp. G-MC3]|uniref:HNH endonuclease signature motif containing protein n=1 Tax=Rhodococcus sp. G-MC3 TaxID=3046209 RepID=UPI0024BB8777|nr:HNH endonuclease signature motif containing protein [Rhodococcus sp. G-MC3]MDJ0393961.1 DUF222 domain-containing protein [Rhodococcus sp. G-MC3]
MFDTGVSAGDAAGGSAGVDAACARAVDDAVSAGLIGFTARCRVAENIARARVVESVCEVTEIRLAAAEDEGGDPATVMRSVVCEIAAGLNVSQMVARPFVETGSVLDRLPLTAVRFVYGNLDWARTQVIARVLGKACDATIKALEFEAVAAAEVWGPRSLKLELWALWAEYDEEEARAAKGSAVKAARGVSLRCEGDGSSVLKATLTDIEGAEAQALVEEIAGTVCGRDPRPAVQLRADGLLALIHGEHALECACDLGEQCPQFGVADLVDGRRGHLLQIQIDVETLLGLTSTPARLADGTALDAEVARVLAEDARWQALLTELVVALDARNSDSDSTGHGSTGNGSGAEKSGTETPEAKPTDGPEATPTDTPAGGGLRGGIRVPRLIFRGRIRRAATVPARPKRTAGSPNRPPARGKGTASDAARAHAVAVLLAAIGKDPALAAGVFPGGHGGLTAPPPGALTYKPGAEVAARVRMRYRTCTHPGCAVPAARCQLDHIVPFDHDNPARGGWSIETNLHPACGGHHQLKTSKLWTVAYLAGGAILWTSRTGIRSITLPRLGCPAPPRSRKRGRKTVEPEPDIKAPTWWEKHMSTDTPEPTAADQRAAETDAARTRIRLLRRRFREHNTIRKLRKNAEPPPF